MRGLEDSGGRIEGISIGTRTSAIVDRLEGIERELSDAQAASTRTTSSMVSALNEAAQHLGFYAATYETVLHDPADFRIAAGHWIIDESEGPVVDLSVTAELPAEYPPLPDGCAYAGVAFTPPRMSEAPEDLWCWSPIIGAEAWENDAVGSVERCHYAYRIGGPCDPHYIPLPVGLPPLPEGFAYGGTAFETYNGNDSRVHSDLARVSVIPQAEWVTGCHGWGLGIHYAYRIGGPNDPRNRTTNQQTNV